MGAGAAPSPPAAASFLASAAFLIACCLATKAERSASSGWGASPGATGTSTSPGPLPPKGERFCGVPAASAEVPFLEGAARAALSPPPPPSPVPAAEAASPKASFRACVTNVRKSAPEATVKRSPL